MVDIGDICIQHLENLLATLFVLPHNNFRHFLAVFCQTEKSFILISNRLERTATLQKHTKHIAVFLVDLVFTGRKWSDLHVILDQIVFPLLLAHGIIFL